jgi:hypothetical protein
MASFTINKSQIPQLKVFNEYCKKMENISPIEEDQSYIIKNDKLNIYGRGAASQIDTVLDISDVKIEKNDSSSFGIVTTNFIKFLEKTQDDEILVSVKDQQMVVKGKNTKQIYKQTLIWNKSVDEIKELETFISSTLKLDEFKQPITIKLPDDYKTIITDLVSMTKLLDVNQSIELNKNCIRVADSLNILKLQIPDSSVSPEDEIPLQREIVALFKGIDSFTISDDKKWFYFDIKEYGIKILFIPKTSEWQYPTDDDLKDIKPIVEQSNTLKIKVEDFYKALNEVDNIFDSDSWKYNELKFKTPVDFINEKKIVLHYDNMKYEVITDLPVDIINHKDKKENFEFTIPTIHFKFLKDILESESTFEVIYSSKDVSEPNGASIIVKNQNLNVVLAKMT